jgi:hypothetical protein
LVLFLDPEDGATYSSETLVDIQRAVWRYIPEDITLQNHRFESFKSYIKSSSVLRYKTIQICYICLENRKLSWNIYSRIGHKVNLLADVALFYFRFRSQAFLFVRKGFRIRDFAFKWQAKPRYMLHYKSS